MQHQTDMTENEEFVVEEGSVVPHIARNFHALVVTSPSKNTAKASQHTPQDALFVSSENLAEALSIATSGNTSGTLRHATLATSSQSTPKVAGHAPPVVFSKNIPKTARQPLHSAFAENAPEVLIDSPYVACSTDIDADPCYAPELPISLESAECAVSPTTEPFPVESEEIYCITYDSDSPSVTHSTDIDVDACYMPESPTPLESAECAVSPTAEPFPVENEEIYCMTYDSDNSPLTSAPQCVEASKPNTSKPTVGILPMVHCRLSEFHPLTHFLGFSTAGSDYDCPVQ